jgi:hypothetical protein
MDIEEALRDIQSKITEIDSRTIRIETVLLGVPGTQNGGLCGQVEEHGRVLSTLKRNFWILVAFLTGSGVLGASIYGLWG